jgi:hypothetical protein
MTLLVVSVVIPVTLVILEVTTKQVRLAGNARDSEVAFHAASAGLECAQRLRREVGVAIRLEETTSPATIPGVSCFGAAPTDFVYQPFQNQPAHGHVNHFVTQFTWGVAPQQRCTRIDMIVMVSEVTQNTVVNDDDIRQLIQTYPLRQTTQTTCPQGGVCTIISSRGYNRACPANFSDILPSGSTQREVLLEY